MNSSKRVACFKQPKFKFINTEWPKKCMHSLLINIFGINLIEISISG